MPLPEPAGRHGALFRRKTVIFADAGGAITQTTQMRKRVFHGRCATDAQVGSIRAARFCLEYFI
jgi:hypothetical protein